ncbi:hypothetical protein A2U01_0077473, partial [Trifolium medium]|nr:hypothetical protein [Trifolium medium]
REGGIVFGIVDMEAHRVVDMVVGMEVGTVIGIMMGNVREVYRAMVSGVGE